MSLCAVCLKETSLPYASVCDKCFGPKRTTLVFPAEPKGNEMKTITVEDAINGYILQIDSVKYVYLDEVELLDAIKEFLKLDQSYTIDIKRKP
jgi:hypothetical protein